MNNNHIESFNAIARKVEIELNSDINSIKLRSYTYSTEYKIPYPTNLRTSKKGEVFKRDLELLSNIEIFIRTFMSQFSVITMISASDFDRLFTVIVANDETINRYRKYKIAYVFGNERDQEIYDREIYMEDVFNDMYQTCIESKIFKKYIKSNFDNNIEKRYKDIDVKNDDEFLYIQSFVRFVIDNYENLLDQYKKNNMKLN